MYDKILFLLNTIKIRKTPKLGIAQLFLHLFYYLSIQLLNISEIGVYGTQIKHLFWKLFQVIAFTCCVVTVILTVTATATADWMIAEGWREGLFVQCISEGAPKPLPFDMEPVPGCGKARSAGKELLFSYKLFIGAFFQKFL